MIPWHGDLLDWLALIVGLVLCAVFLPLLAAWGLFDMVKARVTP